MQTAHFGHQHTAEGTKFQGSKSCMGTSMSLSQFLIHADTAVTESK